MNWMQIFSTEKKFKKWKKQMAKEIYIDQPGCSLYIHTHLKCPGFNFLVFFCCQIWLNFLFVCYEKNKIFFCQTITCHSVDIGSPSNIHINILNVYAYLNLEERPFPVDVNNFTTRVFMVINRIFHILCNYYHHHRSHKNVWHSFFNENNKNEWPDFFCLLIFG